MDVLDPKSSLEVCVKKCPDRDLANMEVSAAFEM